MRRTKQVPKPPVVALQAVVGALLTAPKNVSNKLPE
jgi:hypothetical protein